MILETQKNSTIYQEGEREESIGMSLDLDSAQILMQMLSKNIYSDAVGSSVRECVSNALDSHRRAGVKKPIIVSFKPNKDNNYEFSVEDFGLGLNDGNVREIISKYGKSTKRDDANSLGMYGLGFKSPLAYSSSFYFIARKDGVERKYMMYEGEEVNTIDLLYEAPTNEHNGVKIIIPVKYGDRMDFSSKIEEQLAYFEGVYFDVPHFDNDFTIFRSEHFQYSQIAQDNSLHICLDNVYYPIEFDKLGISRIDVPVGLRFGLSDGIFPTINRESIRYTQEAKKIILDKIKVVADYFMEKYNASLTDTLSFENVVRYYETSSRYVTIGEKTLDVKNILSYSSIPHILPKMKEIELLNLKRMVEKRNEMLKEYEIKQECSNGAFRERKKYSNEFPYCYDVDDKHYYLFSERIPNNKKEWLKSTLYSYNRYYFLKKTKEFKLGHRETPTLWGDNFPTYYHMLSLKDYPRGQWRQVIKEFQSIRDSFTEKFIDVDSLEIPQEWIEARRKQRVSIAADKRQKLQGEVNARFSRPLERYMDGRSCKFVPDTFKLEKFSQKPYLMVYNTHDKWEKLDQLWGMARKQKIECLTFSERELKIIEKAEIHNLISYDKFMEGKNKPFKRLVTAYLIHLLINKYSSVFEKKEWLRDISSSLVEKLSTLRKYVDKNQVSSYNSDIYEAMLEVAGEHNLFDMEIYPLYKEMKTLLERLTFLNPVMKTFPSYGYDRIHPMIDVLIDLFKYYRQRIDYKNYKLKLNEEDTPMGELTKETIESVNI